MTSIATSTHNAYIQQVIRLIKRAKHDLKLPGLTPLQLAQWLIAIRVNYSKSTWRQYKSAVLHVFQLQLTKKPSLSGDIAKAEALLKNTHPPEVRPEIKQTSAKKQKKISEDDLIKLFDCLFYEKSHRGKATIQWLLAGLWTGLRPCEWEHAHLIESTYQLKVKNAKNTQDRSHGEYRIINLVNLDKQMLAVIKIHLENVRLAKLLPVKNGLTGFEQFYGQCRQRLHRANKKLWPKRKQSIPLYSARHQFAADAKYSGLSKEAIAALMGHKSTETHTLHYARKSSGKGGFKVKADEQDVARVVSLNKNRPQKNPPWAEEIGQTPGIS